MFHDVGHALVVCNTVERDGAERLIVNDGRAEPTEVPDHEFRTEGIYATQVGTDGMRYRVELHRIVCSCGKRCSPVLPDGEHRDAEYIAAHLSEHIGVRLSPDGLARVRELAEQETEGNMSSMIRKLLSEALAARERKQTR